MVKRFPPGPSDGVEVTVKLKIAAGGASVRAMKERPGWNPSLEYVVSVRRPHTHYLDVSLTVQWDKPTPGPLRLTMPVWTPGHYVLEEFSRNVPELKAKARSRGGGWEDAAVRKESKNVWKVDWEGEADAVKAEYPVYAAEYTDTKSYVDSDHVIINGASVFVYPTGMEQSPATVLLRPPPGWRKVATGLRGSAKWEFKAETLDVLIDSPIEAGNQDVRSFVAAGAEHLVSLYGKAPVDRRAFVKDLQRIVESTAAVFGGVPYGRYVFIVNFTDGASGGLEHLNSTVCFVPRLRLVPREEYNLTMGLFSHEFFHAWNVKRLKPRGLGPFDYSAETYTKSLWIAEGITSYYDDLILRRAGIYTVPEYLEAFAVNVNLMISLPGAGRQSAQEASFDSWIKFYRPDANSPNVTMSYYTQGAVIGWMLDLQTRKNTGGRRSLDDIMREMYEKASSEEGTGYTEEEFELTAVKVGGRRGIQEIFESRVKGREEVDYDRYLRYVGMRLAPKESPQKVRGFLGVRVGTEAGRTVVRERLDGSPAEGMGVSAGDELIGVDGVRVVPEKLPFLLANSRPGQPVKLTIARNGVISEARGAIGMKPTFEFRIFPMKEATSEQRLLYKGWLGEEWKPEQKYPEYQRSPDRKQSLDYF